jgi:hypothetical protein
MVSATALKMLMQALPREARLGLSYSSRAIEDVRREETGLSFPLGMYAVFTGMSY